MKQQFPKVSIIGAGAVGASGAGRLQTAVGTLTDSKSGGDTYVNQTGALNLDGTTTAAGLLDVLDTALGSRRQPIMWMITTAGGRLVF